MATDAPSRIDAFIAGLPGWQRDLAARLRALVHQADPEIVEDWKWDTPVFARRTSVCAIGAFKDHLKVNFFKGASLPDPHRLLNAGLDAKTSRAIDFREGDSIDEPHFVALVREAAARSR
jgi:hypothetical protein